MFDILYICQLEMNRWNGYLEPGIVYHYLEIPGSQICNRVRSPLAKQPLRVSSSMGILVYFNITLKPQALPCMTCTCFEPKLEVFPDPHKGYRFPPPTTSKCHPTYSEKCTIHPPRRLLHNIYFSPHIDKHAPR